MKDKDKEIRIIGSKADPGHDKTALRGYYARIEEDMPKPTEDIINELKINDHGEETE
jgi:hypothetical protein